MKDFHHVKLSIEGESKAQAVANGFSAFLAQLKSYCPEGRELSLVRTKLQEACFWAKKSVCSEAQNLSEEASNG